MLSVNLYRISTANDTALQDTGKNAFPGHDTISSHIIDRTLVMTFLADLGDLHLCSISQADLGTNGHNRCAIYYMAGDCIMPREGIFARVLKGGVIRCGDSVQID